MTTYLDTNCVIYLVEQNPVWGPKIVNRLLALRKDGHEIATSDLCRTECLAGPFAQGNIALVAEFLSVFNSPQFRMLPLNAAVCERAARLRAGSGFKLLVPDCLHLAAALEHGCGGFLTNDIRLQQCSEIPVEILT